MTAEQAAAFWELHTKPWKGDIRSKTVRFLMEGVERWEMRRLAQIERSNQYGVLFCQAASASHQGELDRRVWARRERRERKAERRRQTKEG